MSREQLNLEELLEYMGTQEVPGDSTHRYGLRRRLLCSRFFDGACPTDRGMTRLFAYTAPMVAGGAIVGVFVLFASLTPMSSGEVQVSATAVEVEVVPIETSVSRGLSNIQVNEFVSDPHEPKVQLAEFEIADSALVQTVVSAQ